MLPATLASLVSCEAGAPSAPIAVARPDLEIVSAGSDPRVLLRYHPAPGTEQRFEMSIAVQLTAGEIGGPMPTVGVQLTGTIEALRRPGKMVVRAGTEDTRARETEGSSVPPVAVEGPLAPLRGLALAGVLAPDGRMTATHLVGGPSALSAETEQQVQSLLTSFQTTMMPLPDSPVGAGAVWRSSRALEQNAIRMKAVNTVTLTAVRGDTIEYTLDTDVHGADQTVKQEDLEVVIKDIVGNGTGRGTIDLAQLRVSSELQASLHTEMTATGDPAPTKLDMTTRTRVQPL